MKLSLPDTGLSLCSALRKEADRYDRYTFPRRERLRSEYSESFWWRVLDLLEANYDFSHINIKRFSRDPMGWSEQGVRLPKEPMMLERVTDGSAQWWCDRQQASKERSRGSAPGAWVKGIQRGGFTH